ncbi:uncharacterized protein LOC62_04G006424 [Vanrija pseudolonga]|uniref:Uncharacterized protein n=1 Tax=Vanrija pseudolonga TaxID=143232 RepID=A0AAF0YFN5_9TREE|nr:hypothetical protein LOC62_04G006424 [Vanrija pseudolonga]
MLARRHDPESPGPGRGPNRLVLWVEGAFNRLNWAASEAGEMPLADPLAPLRAWLGEEPWDADDETSSIVEFPVVCNGDYAALIGVLNACSLRYVDLRYDRFPLEGDPAHLGRALLDGLTAPVQELDAHVTESSMYYSASDASLDSLLGYLLSERGNRAQVVNVYTAHLDAVQLARLGDAVERHACIEDARASRTEYIDALEDSERTAQHVRLKGLFARNKERNERVRVAALRALSPARVLLHAKQGGDASAFARLPNEVVQHIVRMTEDDLSDRQWGTLLRHVADRAASAAVFAEVRRLEMLEEMDGREIADEWLYNGGFWYEGTA